MGELKNFLGCAAVLVSLTVPACSQSGLVGLGQHGDWIVYRTDSDPVQCGIMSIPTSMGFTRDGRTVKANRGNARVIVLYLRGQTDQANLAYESGFPIKAETTATLQISGNTFNLYLDPSGQSPAWAWPTRNDEMRIIEEMRKGNEAVITSISERGTMVRDVYSLRGVTAGLNRARDECT